MPYLLLFAGAIGLKTKFRNKLELEVKELKFEEESIHLLTELDFIEERDDMETVRLDTAGGQPDNIINLKQVHIINSEAASSSLGVESDSYKKPNLSIRVEPVLRRQSIALNDRKLKEAELQHIKQYLDMRYKFSFLIYKIRGCWRVLDIFSTYF